MELSAAGVGPDTRDRLERIGWWIRNDDGVEVWHDRMLTWALAEAIAEKGTVAETANRLRPHEGPGSLRIRRILAYLPMDVLWLLSNNPVRRHLVPDLLGSMEENERPFGFQRLYQPGLLPTLGLPIVPGLVERLRRLPERVRYSYQSLAANALSRILHREPEGTAELPALLKDSSKLVRKVAVRVLAEHPHPLAIEPLWNLLM